MATEKLKEFVGHAEYDNEMQQIHGVDKEGGMQLLLEVRGWGAIQHLFMEKGKFIKDGEKKAGEFQNYFGGFVTDAINEKIGRGVIDKNKKIGMLYSHGKTVIMCTGMGNSDKTFSGVVVRQDDPTSDHHLGSFSNTWTWANVFSVHEGEVVLDNKNWKEYVEVGCSPG